MSALGIVPLLVYLAAAGITLAMTLEEALVGGNGRGRAGRTDHFTSPPTTSTNHTSEESRLPLLIPSSPQLTASPWTFDPDPMHDTSSTLMHWRNWEELWLACDSARARERASGPPPSLPDPHVKCAGAGKEVPP